jgi:hypothetical protein
VPEQVPVAADRTALLDRYVTELILLQRRSVRRQSSRSSRPRTPPHVRGSSPASIKGKAEHSSSESKH